MKKLFLISLIAFIGLYVFAGEIYNSEGYLTEKTENTAEGEVRSVLTYKKNKLIFTSKFLDDNEQPYEIEYYLRSPVDNSLVGVKRYTGTSLVGGNYLYDENTLYLNATDNLVFTTDFEVQNDGNITITNQNGDIETYSSEGLLIEISNSEEKTNYFYDESKKLVSSTSVKGLQITEIEYKEESKYLETIKINDIIQSKTKYESSGKISTVYENNKPFAKVYYYPDNKRVMEIEYL